MKSERKRNERAVLEAGRNYIRLGNRFLNNRTAGLPNASELALVSCPHSFIMVARNSGEDEFGLGMPFIAASIRDAKAPEEERRERYFDPWYYNAMVLAELSGGAFYFDRSKRGRYYFLAFAGHRGSEGRHYLRRSIAKTPERHDTREKRRTSDSHRDYRRATLKWTAKRAVRKLKQLTRSKSRTREDLIKFAVALFELRLQNDVAAKGLGLSASEYETLLREAFRVADAIHEALYGSAVDFKEAAE